MEGRPSAFASNRHHGSLAAVIGGGGVALMMPSPLQHDPGSGTIPALGLSTYSAGEDAGRLATLAKELGLARTRSPKPQLRGHALEAFLRGRRHDANGDSPPRATRVEINKFAENVNSQRRDETKEASPSSSIAPRESRHPPLRFVFSGYSLWLELGQYDVERDGRGDLDRAMADAADEFSLGAAIPSPHVTVMYGFGAGADEEEVRRVFREDARRVLLEEVARQGRGGAGKVWPDLAATGILVGAELAGVDGGEMDMAWAEVSFATSPEHEALVDALHGLFHRRPSPSCGEGREGEYVPRSNPWLPHLSLCYDNPEGFGPNLSRTSIERFMRRRCPTLKDVVDDAIGDVKLTRTVSGISLWRMAGRMDQWKCLDRFDFPATW